MLPIIVRVNMQVYIHPPPGYSYAPGSVFAGLEVPNRVVVQWAQFSVVRRAWDCACSARSRQSWMLMSTDMIKISAAMLSFCCHIAAYMVRPNFTSH